MRASLVPLASLVLLSLAVPSISDEAATDAPATPKPSVERLLKVRDAIEKSQKNFAQGLRSGAPTMVRIQALNKQRLAELTALAEELEAIGPEEQGLEEHKTLADLYIKLSDWDEAVRHARAALILDPKSVEAHAALVTALVEIDLDSAEKAFADALAIAPDSTQLLPLHYRLYIANNRRGRKEVAADHLSGHLLALRPYRKSLNQPTYLRQLSDLVKLYAETKAAEKAVARLDDELQQWEASEDPAVAKSAIAQLQALKIEKLAELGDQEAADKLLATQLEAARKEHEASPEDAAAALQVARLLQAAVAIAGENKEAAKDTWLTFLKDGLAKYPDSKELATELSKAYLEEVRVLGEKQAWGQVEEVAKSYGELLSLAPQGGAAHKALVAGDTQIKGLVRRWESQRLQTELIGKPMIPLETAAWVNGSPLTPEDLKGKVILLDFWAVWCGPCRATFPHLTEWHDKFGKDGLVVIGLTRYYQYDWDKEGEKHVQVADLPPEKEAEALKHFAAHHGLKHRLAFMPKESSLSRSYGVSGIPHVVVIDRDGIIRMIRVGSGEKNARDIENLLEQLVHGTSPAAASASN